VIPLLGVERIKLVIGDREFVGHQWLEYLYSRGIAFCVRVPKNHHITDKNGEIWTLEELLWNKKKTRRTKCIVDGIVGNVFAKRLDGEEFLFIFGTVPTEELEATYKQRWTIECFFQNIKGRGFDLEKTHLKNITKIKTLIALIAIAYTICFALGYFYHHQVCNIPLKKHKYKAYSFFRKGLDIIREIVKNKPFYPFFDTFWSYITNLLSINSDFLKKRGRVHYARV
jgi:hypothetical protein